MASEQILMHLNIAVTCVQYLIQATFQPRTITILIAVLQRYCPVQVNVCVPQISVRAVKEKPLPE